MTKEQAKEIYLDVVSQFGFVNNPTSVDAVYVLRNGKFLDTCGGYPTHQHINVAKYISEHFGLKDLDTTNNGSNFMMNALGAIKITCWNGGKGIKGIYLPKFELTGAQYDALELFLAFIGKNVTEDWPLWVATYNEGQQIEYTKPFKLAERVVADIEHFYYSGKLELTEELQEEATLVESPNSDRINTWYTITDKVKSYWPKEGYGYGWYELADANKSQSAPFYGISGIYLIVNKITDQAYVGKANETARRIYDHKRAQNKTDCPFLHTAIKHWGPQNFKYTLIEETPAALLDDADAELKWFIEKEQEWIATLHTYTDPWNYNLDQGGGSIAPFIVHLDDKIKAIQQELEEHPTVSYQKLAKKFHISDRQIVDINRGIGRFQNIKYRDGLTFPIIDTNPDNLETSERGWNLNSVETKWKIKLANEPWYYVRARYNADTNKYELRRFATSPREEIPGGKSVEKSIAERIKNGFDQILDLDYNESEIINYIEKYKDDYFVSGKNNKVYKIYRPRFTEGPITDFWLRLKLKPEDKEWWKTEYITKNMNKPQTEALLEDTRNVLVSKSRNAGPYKQNIRGKNRFERKKFSQIAKTVKQYNQIDMNKFFKEDLLIVKIPVQGETDSYTVSIRMDGVVKEIANNIKNNKNQLEYRTVIQALTKIFNTQNIYVKCTCDDYKYRFAHWNIINNISVDDTASDPGPGKGIRNPNDDKGRGCKHVLLVLANGDWLLKVASVINNYIHYAEEHLQKPFLKLIFPKLYGFPADEMVEQDIIDDDKYLDSSKGLIDAINEYGRNRGKYKPGSNKNPVTGTGGPKKKEPEPEEKSEEKPDEKPAEKEEETGENESENK